jgi:hypothetical protein
MRSEAEIRLYLADCRARRTEAKIARDVNCDQGSSRQKHWDHQYELWAGKVNTLLWTLNEHPE